MNVLPTPDFPISSLPPIIQGAVRDLLVNIKAPAPLAFTSVMSVVSLVSQDKIRVRRPGDLITVCSLYLFCLGDSGERKTSLDKKTMQSVREFETEQYAVYMQKLELYEIDLANRKNEIAGLEQAIRNSVSKGKSADAAQFALETALSNMPQKPREPKLVMMDATPEAIIKFLKEKWPSAGLVSDEGGVIFSSRSMNNLALLNKLWDGEPLYVERVSRESIVLTGASFTLAILVQQEIFEEFIRNRGKLARGSGLFARSLISRPISTQGYRPIDGSTPLWNNLNMFHARIREILKLGIDNGAERQPEILEFSYEAAQSWVKFFNWVEQNLREGAYLSEVRDWGSKAAENAARIAGLFHFLEGRSGQIQADTMQQAIEVCSWYGDEFKRLFGENSKPPQELVDANLLERWLLQFCQRHPGYNLIKKNVLSQYGPNSLRSKARLDMALQVLASASKIRPNFQGKTQYIELNPSYFPVSGFRANSI